MIDEAKIENLWKEFKKYCVSLNRNHHDREKFVRCILGAANPNDVYDATISAHFKGIKRKEGL